MVLEQFNSYFLFFYHCGISEYTPYPPPPRLCGVTHWLRNTVPAIVLSSCIIILCFFIWALFISTDSESFHLDGSANYLVGRAFVLCVLLTNFVSIFQALLNKSAIIQIVQLLQKSERLLLLYFHRTLPLARMRRSVRRKMILIIGFFLLSVMFYASTYYTDADDMPVYVSLYTAQTFALLICLHVVFYIDLATLLLKSLSLCVRLPFTTNSIGGVGNGRLMRLKIQLLKRVYIEMWQLAQVISKCFGWNIVNLMVYYMMDTTYDLYWLYNTANMSKGILIATRKYRIYNLIKYFIE